MQRYTVLLCIAALLALILPAAALTMEEAKKEFQSKGCAGCHNGALAPNFEGTVEKVREWARKYKSLDEAVAAEAKHFKMYQIAKTWDQLMKMMNVPPELEKFFKSVFEEAKKAGTATTPAKTVTPTTPTETETTPAAPAIPPIKVAKPKPTLSVKTVGELPVTPAGYEPGTEEHIRSGFLAAIGVAIVAFALIGYVWFRG